MSLSSGLQFHLNGYEGFGDPLEYQFENDKIPDFQDHLPEDVDVLVVGAGPAGHLLAAQLSRFPNIITRIIDAKQALEHSYADGLQCRTIEIFEAFGFCEKVLKEGYWVNETCFWSPTEDGNGIRRTGRIRDTQQGLSEQPHIILSQARMCELWRDCMKKSPTRLEPTYGRRIIGLKQPQGDEPIEVTIERTDDAHKGQRETIKARYVVGCDGARSTVRHSLGWHLKGDSSSQTWGVMDVLATTDFPDWRIKCTIHSSRDGSVLIIPREGGYLTRLYVGLDKLQQNERVSSKRITSEDVIERAKRIFSPYKLEVHQVPHFTVYEVGQRLTDHFDDVPQSERSSRAARIFIAGDACHTHSAKAGQGMNVSMNDTYNLGWKLASVLSGISPPILLNTYSEERREIAQNLIDFDRSWSAIFAARPSTSSSSSSFSSPKSKVDDDDGNDDDDGDDADDDDDDGGDQTRISPSAFQAAFERAQPFTAGVATKYKPSRIISSFSSSGEYQSLAKGFEIGTRFHSIQALRLSDAKPIHLGHVLKADGRWRVFVFGDNCTPAMVTSPTSKIWGFCAFLAEKLIPRFTPRGRDVDAVIDVRAVLQGRREEIEITGLHDLLWPKKGRLGMRDYEKVFVDENSYGWGFGDIYTERGLDREKGCVVIVRPDQYISAVMPLSEEAHRPLVEFFDGFMNVVDV